MSAEEMVANAYAEAWEEYKRNNGLTEYMGILYGYDVDYRGSAISGAWLVQFADYDWYFSSESMARAFIWLLNEINRYTDVLDGHIFDGYIFGEDLDDDVFRFLVPELVGIIESRKGEEA